MHNHPYRSLGTGRWLISTIAGNWRRDCARSRVSRCLCSRHARDYAFCHLRRWQSRKITRAASFCPFSAPRLFLGPPPNSRHLKRRSSPPPAPPKPLKAQFKSLPLRTAIGHSFSLRFCSAPLRAPAMTQSGRPSAPLLIQVPEMPPRCDGTQPRSRAVCLSRMFSHANYGQGKTAPDRATLDGYQAGSPCRERRLGGLDGLV